MAPHRPPGGDLLERVAPPLQPDFGDAFLRRSPRRPGDLDVVGVDRKQPPADPRRGGHDGEESVRIAAPHDLSAGGNAVMHRAEASR